MSKPRQYVIRLTLDRPIDQIERTMEVTALISVADPTQEHGFRPGPNEPHKLKIQINVGRLLVALGVKALNSPSGRSQEANGAIVVTVVR